jgi:transmembrane sensor
VISKTNPVNSSAYRKIFCKRLWVFYLFRHIKANRLRFFKEPWRTLKKAMDKSDFDQLLERYLTGQVSDQERIKIEAWLEVMKTDTLHDLTLTKKDEERLFGEITRHAYGNDEEIPLPDVRKAWTFGVVIRMAASIALVLTMTYAGWHFGMVNVAGVKKIILPDGTLAWLKGDSQLSYVENPEDSTRHATLTGEALFEVVKDAKHPFFVACGNVTAKVLGTSFSLKSNRETVELEVLTGKVNLFSSSDQEGVIVRPNEKVIFNRNGHVNKTPLPATELKAIVASTEYDMHFRNTAMEQVLDRVGKKFSMTVVVENSELKKCRITADFTDRSLEVTLQMLSELLDLTYTVNGKTIIISGKGCH